MKKNKLITKILKRKFVAPMTTRLQGLELWSKTRTGQAISKRQKKLVEEKLETLFGYHLMQLSAVSEIDLMHTSKVGHKFSVSRRQELSADLYSDEESLALANDSIDVCIIHHALDYSKNPHNLLREITRVILPSGHILIIGFNPKSLFLPSMIVGRLLRKPAWQTQLLSASRLADWLTVLGFSVESIEYAYYQLPFNREVAGTFFNKVEHFCHSRQLSGGAFYVIVAKKDVSTITPIRSSKKTLVTSVIGSAKPSAYQDTKKRDSK